jgi:hypothetical protein
LSVAKEDPRPAGEASGYGRTRRVSEAAERNSTRRAQDGPGQIDVTWKGELVGQAVVGGEALIAERTLKLAQRLGLEETLVKGRSPTGQAKRVAEEPLLLFAQALGAKAGLGQQRPDRKEPR